MSGVALTVLVFGTLVAATVVIGIYGPQMHIGDADSELQMYQLPANPGDKWTFEATLRNMDQWNRRFVVSAYPFNKKLLQAGDLLHRPLGALLEQRALDADREGLQEAAHHQLHAGEAAVRAHPDHAGELPALPGVPRDGHRRQLRERSRLPLLPRLPVPLHEQAVHALRARGEVLVPAGDAGLRRRRPPVDAAVRRAGLDPRAALGRHAGARVHRLQQPHLHLRPARRLVGLPLHHEPLPGLVRGVPDAGVAAGGGLDHGGRGEAHLPLLLPPQAPPRLHHLGHPDLALHAGHVPPDQRPRLPRLHRLLRLPLRGGRPDGAHADLPLLDRLPLLPHRWRAPQHPPDADGLQVPVRALARRLHRDRPRHLPQRHRAPHRLPGEVPLVPRRPQLLRLHPHLRLHAGAGRTQRGRGLLGAPRPEDGPLLGPQQQLRARLSARGPLPRPPPSPPLGPSRLGRPPPAHQ